MPEQDFILGDTALTYPVTHWQTPGCWQSSGILNNIDRSICHKSLSRWKLGFPLASNLRTRISEIQKWCLMSWRTGKLVSKHVVLFHVPVTRLWGEELLQTLASNCYSRGLVLCFGFHFSKGSWHWLSAMCLVVTFTSSKEVSTQILHRF